jgi:very-short-patch-repair endonuclease
MTPQEVKLWVRLRTLRSVGFHFRRQSPISSYVVDFECRQHRLIVEVDGGQHGFDANQAADAVRGRSLAAAGYRVLRFWNFEVDQNLEGVLTTILAALAEAPYPTRQAPEIRRLSPSPKGEG